MNVTDDESDIESARSRITNSETESEVVMQSPNSRPGSQLLTLVSIDFNIKLYVMLFVYKIYMLLV